MVTRLMDEIVRLDKQCATGRGYLPGRGHSTQPIDFSARGYVRALSGDCVAVKWDNWLYGDYWYKTEYLMPLLGGGF